MDEDNSRLVDYTLVPLKEGQYPDSEGASWAEPGIESAASAMRELADSPSFARSIGLKGQDAVRRQLAPASAANALISQLAALQGFSAPVTCAPSK
jgi:hypothetical protein